MMSKTHFSDFVSKLSRRYESGEANQIGRIVFEDVFRNTQYLDLSEKELSRLYEIQSRLLHGEPIQYILGQADFYGLKLIINTDVLIPRQETESVVYEVVKSLKSNNRTTRLKVLDVGTGSGCIALAVKNEMRQTAVTGVDLSREALAVAQLNNRNLGLCCQFFRTDILDDSQWALFGEYDIIVSNPPYIPPSEKGHMPDRVVAHEPEMALFVEESDALLFYRKIGQFAQKHLAKNGRLIFELNEFRAKETERLIQSLGFKTLIVKDLSGASRVLKAWE